VRKDSNVDIGTTPFDHTVPAGKSPIEFVFRKPGFDDKTLSLVPETPTAALSATLLARAPQPEPRTAAARPPRPRTATTRPKHPPRPVNDEDGVLEPSFR